MGLRCHYIHHKSGLHVSEEQPQANGRETKNVSSRRREFPEDRKQKAHSQAARPRTCALTSLCIKKQCWELIDVKRAMNTRTSTRVGSCLVFLHHAPSNQYSRIIQVFELWTASIHLPRWSIQRRLPGKQPTIPEPE